MISWPSPRRLFARRDPGPPSPIHLVCGADAAYAAWAGVMLASVLRFDHGAGLHIHLLSDGADPPVLRQLGDMAAARGAGFSVHDVAGLLATRSDRLPLAQHLTRAAYARLFFAEMLPASATRAIYVDVDIICRAPLAALWGHDLGHAVAAVARDCAVGAEAGDDQADAARMARDRHARRLGLPEDGTYFNSGVMLIDVARWRAEAVGAACAAWTAAHPDLVQLADQDPLNVVLRDRVAWLDDGWNRLALWAWRAPDDAVRILHFAGPDKPWHSDHAGPGGAEWLAVKAASPLRDTKLVARGAPPPPVWQAGEDGDRRGLLVRATGGAALETAGAAALICNDPARVDVFAYGPHVALPPGSYAATFGLAVLADLPGEAPRPRKLLRVQACVLSGTKQIASLDVGVPPDTDWRDRPVTLDFVLPGPVHDLEFWVSASRGVRVNLNADVRLLRRHDAWGGERRP